MNSTRQLGQQPFRMIFHSAFVITTTFCFISTFVICIGSFTVLYAIFKNPRKNLRTPSTMLFINLSFSDFLTGFLLGTMMTVDSMMDVYDQNSVILDSIIFVLGSLLLFVNNLTIASISVDRLLAVSKPLHYKSVVTLTSVKFTIFMVWLLSFLICLLPVLGVSKWVFLLIYSHSHASLPLLVLTLIYIEIFRLLAKQRKEIRDLQNYKDGQRMTLAEQNRDRKRMERDRQLTVTIVLVMLSFSISSLPFLICVHLMFHIENCNGCISLYNERLVTSVFYFSARFVILNAVLDPLLIVWRMPKVREAVRLSTLFRLVLPRSSRVHNTQSSLPSNIDTYALPTVN